jgi:hypothetical protein
LFFLIFFKFFAEFERLESTLVLGDNDDEDVKIDLSEIEEGHESQVSDLDDQETEICGEPEEESSSYDPDPDNILLSSEEASEDKMMRIFSERIDLPTDSSETSSSSFSLSKSKTNKKSDPIAFFTQTIGSQDDGTTDADSSLEFQKNNNSRAGKISRGMTESGDSLEENPEEVGGGATTPQNLMQVSRDSFEKVLMTQSSDSLEKNKIMTDSLEGLPSSVKMSESVDSLGGGTTINLPSTSTMNTSTDSLEGGVALAEGGGGLLSSSSSNNTNADAAAMMWSSSGGSISTLVSSQEDLTLEGGGGGGGN